MRDLTAPFLLVSGLKEHVNVRTFLLTGMTPGESVPLAATVNYTDKNYLETKNIGLQGTHCASGTCTGVVVATGNRTVFGRIAKLTNEPKTGLTPLEREVLHFVYVICSIMFCSIVLVVVLW